MTAALCATDRPPVDEALMEAGHPPKHLLAVGVELLQLVLDQNGIQRSALLDQVLPEHNESVDLVGVQGNLLLEGLQTDGDQNHAVNNQQETVCHKKRSETQNVFFIIQS